jgi:hypothetical protein
MSVSKDNSNKSNLFENDIYSSIVNSIKNDNIIDKKIKKTSNNICIAAKRHQTKELSMDDLKNGRTVILIKENTSTNGKLSTYSSYTSCSRRPSQCNNTLCTSHYDIKYKIFKDLIKLNDVIIPTETHEYYKNMGERGAKKKNSNLNNSLINNSNNSSINNINKILLSNDKKLISILEDCASKINSEFELHKDSISSVSGTNSIEIAPNRINSTVNANANANSNANINENVDNNSDDDEVNFTNNDSEDETNLSNINNTSKEISNIINKDESDTDNIDEDENEDEDVIETDEIQTMKNGRKFYVDKNLVVYEPNEGNFDEVGNLMIVNKKYAQIEYNSKNYSIFTNEIRNGIKIFKCFLTDNEFDTNMKLMK